MVDTERYQQEIASLRNTIIKAGEALNLAHMEEELTELKEEMNSPEFWTDLERSTSVTRRARHLEAQLEHVRRLHARCDDVEAMLSLLNEDPDEEMGKECDTEIQTLRADADALELETLMRGEYDECNCVLSLHAGAGRHRGAGLDADAVSHVHALLRTDGFQSDHQRCAGR